MALHGCTSGREDSSFTGSGGGTSGGRKQDVEMNEDETLRVAVTVFVCALDPDPMLHQGGQSSDSPGWAAGPPEPAPPPGAGPPSL